MTGPDETAQQWAVDARRRSAVKRLKLQVAAALVFSSGFIRYSWYAGQPEPVMEVSDPVQADGQNPEQSAKRNPGASAGSAQIDTAQRATQRARKLVALSRGRTAAGDAVTGALLALEALPDNLEGVEIPAATAIEHALYAAHFSHREVAVLGGYIADVHVARFSPDGKFVLSASSDRTARLWHVADATEAAFLKGHSDEVWSAAFGPGGPANPEIAPRAATVALNGFVRLWDGRSGKLIAVIKGHEDAVVGVDFGPHGRLFVTASHDGTARLWDARTGARVGVLKGHQQRVLSAVFSPDGQRILTTSDDATARLWNVKSGTQTTVLAGHSSGVTGAAFSPDGARLATGSRDHTVRLWDGVDGAKIAVLRGHTGWVNALVFGPDGKRLASASGDYTARLWTARTGASLAKLGGHGNEVASVAFSGDGRRLLTASGDGTARLWETRGPVSAFGSAGSVKVLVQSHSSDRKRRVRISDDRLTMRILDAANDAVIAVIAVLKSHQAPIAAAAFSADGRRVVSASADGTARLWDAATGAEIGRIEGAAGALARAGFSPDGRHVVIVSKSGHQQTWRIFADLGSLVLHLKDVLPRTLTRQQRRQYVLKLDFGR